MLLKKKNNVAGADTSNLAAKSNFIALRADKKDINKLDISLDNLKIKLDALDVGKLKTIPVDLKKFLWCSRCTSC